METYSRKIIIVKYFLIEKTETVTILRGGKMNFKKVVVLSLSLSTLLLTLTYSAVVKATPEERRTVYEMDSLGLKLSIIAPYFAYPGENINVTVTAEASDGIDIEYIHISIRGLTNETEEISPPLKDIHITTMPYQANHTITIPNETAPGLLYGIINWGKLSLQFPGGELTITPPPAGFVVTYVKNMELEELQAAYDELLANYTKLKNYKGELGATRNLMYIFVATTIVSAVTAFLLLIRRPKRLWA